MLTESDLSALFLSLKLAGLTVLILLIIGTPLAWWLARSQWRYKFLLEAIIALPLVLPPTVLVLHQTNVVGVLGLKADKRVFVQVKSVALLQNL